MNIRNIDKSEYFRQNSIENKIQFLLKYAILAPSTHNSQPWLFKIEFNKCKVYYNPNLLIPKADPKTRDLHISIGCAIENLIIASKYFNIFHSISYGPFDEKELLAELTFNNSSNLNSDFKELLDVIPKRITARGLFKSEKINSEIIKDVYSRIQGEYSDGIYINFIDDSKKITEIAELTAEGLKIAYKDKTFRKEMSKWLNHNLSTKKHGLHGYALRMPFLLSFIIPTLVRFKDIGSFLAKLNFKSINSAPLITVISADQDNPLTWIKVGRTAERLMLEFHKKKLNTSIFVASIEMGDLYKKLQKIVNTNKLPQFLFVVGKIDSLHSPTPRHKLEKKIIK